MSNNNLGHEITSSYDFFFRTNKTLEILDMNNCGIGPIGTYNLMKIIKENKEIQLKILRFSENKIEDKGCSAISELIKEKNTIKEITISDNEIDYGLEQFFNAIQDNKNISLIDVHGNNFGDKNSNIPKIVGSLSNIVYLNLSSLYVEDKNIIINIFETLIKLTKLKYFYFEYNIFDLDFENEKEKDKYISQLFEYLLQTNLIEIHLENNEISKIMYNNYSQKFKDKGVLFSCFSEEEISFEDI